VEVDFSEVTRKKATLIGAKEVLLTKLGPEPKISMGASFFSLLHKLILCLQPNVILQFSCGTLDCLVFWCLILGSNSLHLND
jgi:hypothetical protein